MTEAAEIQTDVLVVGSGPMGASAALALATYGVRVHVITQTNWLANGPRAHVTNQRAVEVLRDLGVEDEAALYGTPWKLMGDMTFATSLAGEELVRIRSIGTGDDRLTDYVQASPCSSMDLPQLYMEPILVNNAAARGASFSFNTEYLDHQQDGDGVTVRVRDRLADREYLIRTKYLVGADGGRSRVAEKLGLPLEGHMARAATAYVQFKADLARYVQHRPSIIHFILSPLASFGEIGFGLLRCIRPWHTWITGWGYDMEKGGPDFSEGSVKERIRRLVGDPELEIEITGTSTWFVNQMYATEYASGRVLCGGDAVHRHPPSSGLGSNTSVQDAFNLAWKLAYVLKGHAGESLLATYSAERAPVGKQVVLRANQSRRDYAKLQEVFRTEGSSDPVAATVAKIRDPGPDGVATRKALADAQDVKQVELNGHGVEMNHRYESTAILPDQSAGEEIWRRDPAEYAQATSRPGAKIPHAWLVDRHGERISTLDVVGKGKFTVVTGLSGGFWAEAVRRLDLPYLRVVVIGADGSRDPYLEWARRREIEEAGALLVRPDGVVGWRRSTAVRDEREALTLLSDTLSAILARPVGRNLERQMET